MVPPPGTYIGSIKYFYTGEASGGTAVGRALGQTGNITLQADVKVKANVFMEIPNAIWVPQRKVLGGHLGLMAFLPVGWMDTKVDVNALATLTLPNGTTHQRGRRFSLSDDTVNFGDPLLGAMLGWHQGNLHWLVAGVFNVPIGAYDKNDLSNMGFNRWAFDATAAVTWLDPQKGHEISVAVGFQFNGENPDTNYKTGTELHIEFALMQHLSKALAIGVAGGHHEQLTGDSGAGATLGSFKGRTTLVGPNMTYNFQLGKTLVLTSLRWLHEFNVKNRAEGDAVFFTATIPLGAPSH